VREAWDAVVVGSGPNGLVAANRLADAGWSVLVLEGQPTYGGAVRSDKDVHDGFVHDTFSAFYPLGVASPPLASLDLEQHGLVWEHAPAVLGHVFGDGAWAMLHRDRAVTASLLDAGDGDAWLRLCDLWDRIGDDLVGALLAPFPPVRSGLRLGARIVRGGGLGTVRDLLTPAYDLAEGRFRGRAARALLAGNAGHSDIPLHAPGSGLLGVLMTMLGQTVGFPAPRGGAGMLTEALVRRLRTRGGEVRCDSEVTRIVVEGGRAVAVRVGDQELRATHAVLADVTAPLLYGGLVPTGDLPTRVVRGMRDFQLDPATVKVDWALDGPVPWAVTPPYAPGTVHVATSFEAISEALGQVASGLVPRDPFLLVGQMTTTDPTRSPAGTESLWAYTHVPQRVLGDVAAGDHGVRGVWDHDDCERFADRMQAQLERVAPDFASRILARRVLGPRELEARDASLVGGSLGGGSSQLHQQLVFRPVPGLGRAETGIGGLFLASSSAHPGGGVHGAAGMNAARAALGHARLDVVRRPGRGLPLRSRRRSSR
jgi:phytoene dehydrogenase-like protein